MNQYLSVLQRAWSFGTRQKNRTGIDTVMVPGDMMQFDMQKGFPIVTTKAVNFKLIVAELLAFIHGADSAATFRQYGTKIWDQNANENKAWLANPHRKGTDDLGRVYGVQWRSWRGITNGEIDQLAEAIDKLVCDPESRRIIVTAWNPDEIEQMALPPCHLLYQFLLTQEGNKLNMTMYMRSCDMFLGVPFNISSYALLLSIVAKALGFELGWLTMFLADVHVYLNHRDQVVEQLARTPRPLPKLVIKKPAPGKDDDPVAWIEELLPEDFELDGYDPLPALKGAMAV